MGQIGTLALRGWESTRGTDSPSSKLDDEKVRTIRRANNAKRDKEFAKEFGVSPAAIAKVRRWESWVHVKTWEEE